MRKFQIQTKDAKDEERFTHGYYQGLIIEIGNMKHFTTYVPAQDQNRMFLEKPLIDKSGTLRGRRMPDGKTGDGQLPLLHCGYFDLWAVAVVFVGNGLLLDV